MTDLTFYEIRIEGYLPDSWSDWFDGLVIESDTDTITILRGTFADQSALLGVLTRIQALNLTVISVNRLPDRREA